MLAAGFAELAAQLGARDLADTRDPVASVHAVLAAFPAEWLLVFDNAPGPGSGGAVPAAGRARAGADHQPQRDCGRRARRWRCRSSTWRSAAGFLVTRTGDPDEQAAAELAERAGRAAAGAGAGRRLHPGHRGQPGRVPGLVPAAAGGPAGPRRAAGYPGTVATTWALAFTQLEQSAPRAAGLLRLLAFCAPEASRCGCCCSPAPGSRKSLAREVAAVLVPLLEDELAAGDAVAALRRYSLVRPAGDGAVSVHRLVQAVTADQMPDDLRRGRGGRPPPP